MFDLNESETNNVVGGQDLCTFISYIVKVRRGERVEICGGAAVSSKSGYFVQDVATVVEFEGAAEFYDAPGRVAGYVQRGAESNAPTAFY